MRGKWPNGEAPLLGGRTAFDRTYGGIGLPKGLAVNQANQATSIR